MNIRLKTILILTIIPLIFSSCAKLQELRQSTNHGTDNVITGVGDSITDTKASYYESGMGQFFGGCERTTQNRIDNYINWSSKSSYNTNAIIARYLKKTNSKRKKNTLSAADEMQILKTYFLKQKEQEHIRAFQKIHKKPKFDKFKSDSDNIDMINQYKLQLTESKHQWNINLNKTKNLVAQKMYQTFYKKPIITFNSYNTFWDEAYFTVSSSEKGFSRKIKIDVEPEIARGMEANIKNIKQSIYFKISDSQLQFVGINLNYGGVNYCADIVDNTYVRENNIVFTDTEISLKSIEISYSQTMRNITPPLWFRKLSVENHIIGYGEGMTKDEATAQARVDIRESIDVTIQSDFEQTKEAKAGSFVKSSSSHIQSTSTAKTLRGSTVVKEEKKDGLWFVGVKYKI